MKSGLKLVPIAIVAVMGILLCLLWQRPAESKGPASAEVGSIRALPPQESLESRGSANEALRSQEEARLQLGETIGIIHLNLRRWLKAKEEGSEEREEGAMAALQAMVTDQNAPEIIRSLSPEELQTPFGMTAIRHWMNASPVQASNWIAALPNATRDEAWAVAQGWRADSEDMPTYLDQLPDGAWKQCLLEEAASQESATDPVAAVELAQRMDPGSERTGLLQSVAGNWIGSDPNAALAWINRINDPSLREELVAAAAESYALTDPAQAAGWLGSTVTSAGIAKDAALNIAQTWVTKDPAAAANWVSQFPDGDTKTAAVDIISRYWQQTDPAAASAWIQNISGGKAGNRPN